MSAEFAALRRFLREQSGLALEEDKRYLVEDRLRGLLRRHAIRDIDELSRRLSAAPRSPLAEAVAEALTINETSFFRDRALFTNLAQNVLPGLVEARRATRRLRIWCAGCSTGQEPYSLAMILEDMARLVAGWEVEIVATDLSRAALATARAGLYSQFEVQRGLPVTYLLRHFTRIGDEWQIGAGLKARIDFRPGNLLAIPRGFGPFDVIFCRNVLFYFDDETRRRVTGRLVENLAPDGFVVLGGAERLGALGAGLLGECPDPFLYRRTDATPRPPAYTPLRLTA